MANFLTLRTQFTIHYIPEIFSYLMGEGTFTYATAGAVFL